MYFFKNYKFVSNAPENNETTAIFISIPWTTGPSESENRVNQIFICTHSGKIYTRHLAAGEWHQV